MKVTREMLELGSIYIAPKELDNRLHCVYVNETSIVSTNTKALAVVKHYGKVEKDFYVHGDVVRLALKQIKASSFVLSEHNIICFDKKGNEFITISKKYGFLGEFPAYKNAIPTATKKNIPFMTASQVDGIFALSGVLVDAKYIPKKLSEDFKGYIGINETNKPVVIANENKDIMLVMYPIVHNYLEFTEQV